MTTKPKAVEFEAWAVSLPGFDGPYVHEPEDRNIPWLTPSSEQAAQTALVQRDLGIPLASFVRVRVTVRPIEGGE